MSIIKYLKYKINYITLVFILIAIIDIYLISLRSLENRYIELVYINMFALVIAIGFFTLDYLRWKYKYSNIFNCIEEGSSIEEYLINGDSFEEEIIREIIKNLKKESEIELSKYKNATKDLDEYISKWIHEIKIPISALNIITERLDSPEDSISIKNETEKMNFLVNSILYGSRSTNLFDDVFINKVNLDDLVKKSIKNNAFLLIKNNLDVELKDLNYEVYTDIKCILYSFDQIINNAIKYSKERGKIEFNAKSEENCVVLSIKDYGIGISKEDVSRVFDKGFTGSNGRERVYKSTGMGLYFSKNIMDKLGHKVEVSSEKNVYTEFRIFFYNISDYFV
ncbi:sensor histidine kinase [Metaclostridioides mangenotii]|uniref:histidine kinase n=1 Tax=Metaclostridioides mangenotii TaxID=1540 RepID=A0ABS4EC27_9FIRM|nr:sensor histidine kinase [Clostridioides mangenotii]MBP1855491.1 signal transduction histidine kinase [Clostridioides mangenotii]